MKIMVVDACVRGEKSRTKMLYEQLLKQQAMNAEIEIVKLAEEPLAPLTAEQSELRDSLVRQGRLEHELFRYARGFREADRIIIAAPYWDLSFPSVLKVYLEHVCAAGVTFGYEGAESVGYCKAEKIIYLSTCGGCVQGAHLGAEYVRSLGAMLGIHSFQQFAVQGLDIDPLKADAIMEEGIGQMLSQISLL